MEKIHLEIWLIHLLPKKENMVAVLRVVNERP